MDDRIIESLGMAQVMFGMSREEINDFKYELKRQQAFYEHERDKLGVRPGDEIEARFDARYGDLFLNGVRGIVEDIHWSRVDKEWYVWADMEQARYLTSEGLLKGTGRNQRAMIPVSKILVVNFESEISGPENPVENSGPESPVEHTAEKSPGAWEVQHYPLNITLNIEAQDPQQLVDTLRYVLSNSDMLGK